METNKILFTSTLLLFITFNYSYAQSTSGSYYQGKNYKSVRLTGYGTDKAGGYDKPRLILNKFDEGTTNLYLKYVYAFNYYGTKENAELNGAHIDENLEVFFIFPDDKKNKKWELTSYSFGCEDKDFKDSYDCIFINQMKNVSSNEILDKLQIINKLMKSKEVVITLTDDLASKDENNVCRFKTKTHNNKLEKVLSSKHFSKDQELLN